MTEISQEALEAAADALYSDACPEGDGGYSACASYDREARIALEAAMPFIEYSVRQEIYEKIRVEMRRADAKVVGFSAVGDAYAHAARIAERVYE